jgi:hypothetical protein
MTAPPYGVPALDTSPLSRTDRETARDYAGGGHMKQGLILSVIRKHPELKALNLSSPLESKHFLGSRWLRRPVPFSKVG